MHLWAREPVLVLLVAHEIARKVRGTMKWLNLMGGVVMGAALAACDHYCWKHWQYWVLWLTAWIWSIASYYQGGLEASDKRVGKVRP